MELLGKVRRMFHRDKLSRSEIARRTGLSRNTVKKCLQAAEGATPKYRRPVLQQFRHAGGWLCRSLISVINSAKRLSVSG